MRDIGRFYQQPEKADFESGAFLGNGKGFVLSKDGRVVPLVAWHINRLANQEEIAKKDFFIAPMTSSVAENHGGWAGENADFIVYDWDEWINVLSRTKVEWYRDGILKAAIEKGAIVSRKIGKKG